MEVQKGTRTLKLFSLPLSDPCQLCQLQPEYPLRDPSGASETIRNVTRQTCVLSLGNIFCFDSWHDDKKNNHKQCIRWLLGYCDFSHWFVWSWRLSVALRQWPLCFGVFLEPELTTYGQRGKSGEDMLCYQRLCYAQQTATNCHKYWC